MNTPTVNPFKARLLAGERLAGLWANLGGETATEVLLGAPIDWLGIDCEHAPNTLTDVLARLRVMQGSAVAPVVRVGGHDAGQIRALLDIGVRNLLIPQVDTAQEARAAVSATRYPPKGTRGYGSGHRAGNYGRNTNYLREADDSICVIAMVETLTALDNLAAIAGEPGVDAIYIGAADLAADMGLIGQGSDPRVKEKVEAAIAGIRAHGCIAGISVQSGALYQRYHGMGATLFAIGHDAQILAKAADQHIASILG